MRKFSQKKINIEMNHENEKLALMMLTQLTIQLLTSVAFSTSQKVALFFLLEFGLLRINYLIRITNNKE